MKTEILYGGLLVFAIIGLIALSGCIGKPSVQTYTTPEGQITTSEENSYEATPDIPITDPTLKEADKILRPVFKDVFGGAKVTTVYNTPSGSAAMYIIPRETTQEDYQTLVNKLKDSGYNITMQSVTDESFGFLFSNGEVSVLIGGNFGEDSLVVTAMTAE